MTVIFMAGSTGFLGRHVSEFLSECPDVEPIALPRSRIDAELLMREYDCTSACLLNMIGLHPRRARSTEEVRVANLDVPYALNQSFLELGGKEIVTTGSRFELNKSETLQWRDYIDAKKQLREMTHDIADEYRASYFPKLIYDTFGFGDSRSNIFNAFLRSLRGGVLHIPPQDFNIDCTPVCWVASELCSTLTSLGSGGSSHTCSIASRAPLSLAGLLQTFEQEFNMPIKTNKTIRLDDMAAEINYSPCACHSLQSATVIESLIGYYRRVLSTA